jgi:thiamine monophosphate synthase
MSVRAAARAERGGADFVQVGPVFDDISGLGSVEGLALLRKVRDAVHLPVVAFGGISSPDHAAASVAAGATGIAVGDPILSAADPRQAAEQFAAVFSNLA